MDKRYELYCLADRLFYDSPARSKLGGGDFALTSRPLPEGWNQFAKGEWIVCVPAAGMARTQGWKIHVSGCLDNATDVLKLVWEYCVDREISFKYLCGKSALLMRNAKYAPRGGSGKFITIYPADDTGLEVILSQLGSILEGQRGPYILSDLRYGDGPLYVRYGGFTERYCEDDGGELVAAIEDATGRLVPDHRTPVFSVPGWVELPAFLAPHLKARKAITITDLPFRIEAALHFSNGGGVYSAIDTRTGDKVVLKEARPHAGLASDGADAVARLRRERDILRHLDGIPAVPRVRDYFECGGHHFLVQEFVEGRPLNSFYAERYPLVSADPDPEALGAYTAWALRICAGVEDAVRRIHGRGVVFNDLHMFNVMVRPDDSVALLDFEVAAHVDEGRRPTIGNPGFVAPRDRTGFGVDRYSLACLRLAMFMPLTTLFPSTGARPPTSPRSSASFSRCRPAIWPRLCVRSQGARRRRANQPAARASRRMPAASTRRGGPCGARSVPAPHQNAMTGCSPGTSSSSRASPSASPTVPPASFLEMQGMDVRDGHGGGSDLSVLLCDSAASITLCL